MSRRERIMRAAISAIRKHGFQATGIDEIGEAAGITGPAIYRHFGSKQAILATAIDEAGDQIQASLERAVAPGGSPDELLRRMIASYVDAAIEHEALIAIWLHESRHLDPVDVETLLKRQRDYIREWTTVLQRFDTSLSSEEAETTVHVTLNAINTVVHHDSRLASQRLRELLCDIAERVMFR